jgi:hypothetical protein
LIDRIRAEAWRGLAGDARDFYESHPFAVLIAGAVLGSAITSRPQHARVKRGILGLLSWIGPVLRFAAASHRAPWGIPSNEGRIP